MRAEVACDGMMVASSSSGGTPQSGQSSRKQLIMCSRESDVAVPFPRCMLAAALSCPPSAALLGYDAPHLPLDRNKNSGMDRKHDRQQ